MNHWSTFVVTVVFFAIVMANIDGLVYNVCTSDGPHGINSLLSQNISYTGVSIKILNINPSGSLDIQVSSKKKIKDIVLWAEYRGKSKKEQHIGTFRSIVGHAYIEGCDGPFNSTITNYEDLVNTSQIIYEWDPPPGTKVALKHGKKKPHHVHKPFPGEKGHRHHHHHKDKKKHKRPHHGNYKKHHKNKKHHHHKFHHTHKSHHHHKFHHTHKSHHHHKSHHTHKSHHHRIIDKFTFKGLAFLEGESVKFHVFTLDKPIYIQGRFSPLDVSLTDPSTLSEGESTDTEVYVSSFDSRPTSSSQSSKVWNGRGMTAISFLIAGMLIL